MSSRLLSDRHQCTSAISADFPGIAGLEAQIFSVNPSLLVNRVHQDYLNPSQWSSSAPEFMWDGFYRNQDDTAFISPAEPLYIVEHSTTRADGRSVSNMSSNTSPLHAESDMGDGLDPQLLGASSDTPEIKVAYDEDGEADQTNETTNTVTRKRAKSTKASRKANSRDPETVKAPRSTRTSDRGHRQCRKKPVGIPLPKTLAEATQPDLMMWEWKNAGRNWKDIRKEWQRLTGHHPANSTLSVRYMKINEIMTDHGAATDAKLCEFKKEAEQELCVELWDRVAAKMLAYHPHSEHNPSSLKKRYTNLVRSGFVKDQPKFEPTEANLGYNRFLHSMLNANLSINGQTADIDRETAGLIASMQTSRSMTIGNQQEGAWPMFDIAEVENSDSPAPVKVFKPLVDYESDA